MCKNHLKEGISMLDLSGWHDVGENTTLTDTLRIDTSAPKMNLTESPWENGGEGEEVKPIKSGW